LYGATETGPQTPTTATSTITTTILLNHPTYNIVYVAYQTTQPTQSAQQPPQTTQPSLQSSLRQDGRPKLTTTLQTTNIFPTTGLPREVF